jgi:hypothetical protein
MASEVTLEDLWDHARGCENALRYYSDIIAAIGAAVGRQRLYRIEVPRGLLEEFELPFPACCGLPDCPPWCYVETGPLKEGLDNCSRITRAVFQITRILIDKLEAQETHEFHAYTSEQPGTCWHGEGRRMEAEPRRAEERRHADDHRPGEERRHGGHRE